MRRYARPFVLTAWMTIGVAAVPSAAAAQTLPAPPVAASQSTFDTARPTGLRDIFGGAIADFAKLPSFETLAILSIGGVGSVLGHTADASLTRTLSSSERMGSALSAGETIGAARTQFAGAVATYALGRMTDSPRIASLGADLIRAQIVTQTLTAGIKLSVGRNRPDGTQYSFPSGHASVTFATATVLQRNFGWKVGVPAYGMATYVAASRVQVKRHFLSDVTFGAALGIVAGRAVTVGRGDTRFAVSPAAVPGGGGVNFTLLPKR